MYKFIKKIILLLILFYPLMASEISIDANTKDYSLLQESRIFIDHKKKEPKVIINNSNFFQETNKSALNLGATRDKIWIEVKLYNRSNQPIQKILLPKDPSLEHIHLYNTKGELLAKRGVVYSQTSYKTLFFYFPITLQPKEHKRLFLEVYNKYVPLGFSLLLTDEQHYLNSDRVEQMIDIFLLGMIFALILYSLVMCIYLKEPSYFFYALYLSTLLYMMFAYLGFSPLLFSKSFILLDLHLTIFRVYTVTLATAFFAIYFLKIWRHKRLYWLYLLFIALTLVVMLFYHDHHPKSINMALFCSTIIIVFNFIAGLIVYRRGYTEARFYLVGFGVVLISYLIMISDALGLSYITQHYYNLILWTTLFEALALSLAFADRYTVVQQNLFYEINHKKEQVEKEVKTKTQQIEQMLNTKELLLRELHHRVKNNLYIIISMVQMQGRNSSDISRFQELENRIHAISKSYDTLMLNQDLDQIEMKSYLGELITQISQGFAKEQINISTNINATLPLSHAVYIGLIVNELVTNSYKYAFVENKGEINIELTKEGEKHHLTISDNGQGFDPTTKRSGSLGLILVESLVIDQLKGLLTSSFEGGVRFEVLF